jgi:hypothetical protein
MSVGQMASQFYRLPLSAFVERSGRQEKIFSPRLRGYRGQVYFLDNGPVK